MRVWFVGMSALLGLPLAAAATELNSGIGSELHWTDNVYFQSTDEVSDYSGRISPWAEVADRDGDFTWGLRYEPSYEYYLHEQDARGFDHDADGRLAWQMGQRTTLRLADRFRRYQNVSRFNEQAEPGEDVTAATRTSELTTNELSAGIEHLLDGRNTLFVNLYTSLQDYDDEGQIDRDYYGSSLVYWHRWSERATIGATASWNRQTATHPDFDDRDTDYYNLSALFFYELSPTLHFSASAGPALVVSDVADFDAPASVNRATFPLFQTASGVHFVDADTCPRNGAGERQLTLECNVLSPALGPGQLASLGANTTSFPVTGPVPSVDDSSTTYFADVSLTKDWERFQGALSYRRSEDRSTGLGAVSDIFSASLRWQATRRFNARLTTSYQIREQATEGLVLVSEVSNQPTPVPAFPLAAQTQAVRIESVGSDASMDVMVATLRLDYALTRRSTLYSTMVYREETFDGEALFARDLERFAIAIGIQYAFDPFDF